MIRSGGALTPRSAPLPPSSRTPRSLTLPEDPAGWLAVVRSQRSRAYSERFGVDMTCMYARWSARSAAQPARGPTLARRHHMYTNPSPSPFRWSTSTCATDAHYVVLDPRPASGSGEARGVPARRVALCPAGRNQDSGCGSTAYPSPVPRASSRFALAVGPLNLVRAILGPPSFLPIQSPSLPPFARSYIHSPGETARSGPAHSVAVWGSSPRSTCVRCHGGLRSVHLLLPKSVRLFAFSRPCPAARPRGAPVVVPCCVSIRVAGGTAPRDGVARAVGSRWLFYVALSLGVGSIGAAVPQVF